MASRKTKQPRQYSWASKFNERSPEYAELSGYALMGLGHARALADAARWRATEAITDHRKMSKRFTVKDLALEQGESPAEINRQIRQARIEVFGKDLGDSAIYNRLKHLDERRGRTCAEPDCDQPIRSQEPISRVYCTEHSKPKYRTRRTRLNQRTRNPNKHTTDAEP